MSRKLFAVSIIFMLALGLAGCVKTHQHITIDVDGMAKVSFLIIGDAIMAGDELNLLAWQMQQMIPQLNTEYERDSYIIKQDFSDYQVYEWKGLTRVPVTDIPGVSWSDQKGSYVFSLRLDPVFDEVTEESRNDVIMEITVVMPAEIDIANTTFVDGATARWVLTKEQLSKTVTLKAITE